MLKDNLKRYRLQKGYSRLKLAKETGLSARCIEHIEFGKALNPKITTIEKLSKALDIPLQELVK